MFELLCNILLFVFLGFTYFTHVLEAKVPKSYMKNPNVLHPSVWPKAIIILLLVCIAINIYKIIKKNKGNPECGLSDPGTPGIRGDRCADHVQLWHAAG